MEVFSDETNKTPLPNYIPPDVFRKRAANINFNNTLTTFVGIVVAMLGIAALLLVWVNYIQVLEKESVSAALRPFAAVVVLVSIGLVHYNGGKLL